MVDNLVAESLPIANRVCYPMRYLKPIHRHRLAARLADPMVARVDS
jgi:hypothetical protein